MNMVAVPTRPFVSFKSRSVYLDQAEKVHNSRGSSDTSRPLLADEITQKDLYSLIGKLAA